MAGEEQTLFLLYELEERFQSPELLWWDDMVGQVVSVSHKTRHVKPCWIRSAPKKRKDVTDEELPGITNSNWAEHK